MAEPPVESAVAIVVALSPAADLENAAGMPPAEARELAALQADATPAGTIRTYSNRWKHFALWCAKRKLAYLPAAPETIARYVLYLQQTAPRNRHGQLTGASCYSVSYVTGVLSAIADAHKRRRLPCAVQDPCVRDACKGVKLRQADRKSKKAAALTPDILRRIMLAQPKTLAGVRNRALLALGFNCAARRSELVAVQVEHLTFDLDGGVLLIKKSKRDQEGKGQHVRFCVAKDPELCPVQAMQRWLLLSGVKTGCVFRKIDKWGHLWSTGLRPGAVNAIVAEALKLAGLESQGFTSHSLRAGLITFCAQKGVRLERIAETSRHKNLDTLLGYVRPAARDAAIRGLL